MDEQIMRERYATMDVPNGYPEGSKAWRLTRKDARGVDGKLDAFMPTRHEPDRIEWMAHGLQCLARRGGGGAWCGYVGIGEGHPSYNVDEDAVGFRAHGGLTYASECHDDVCHVAKPGEPDDLWWLGFDCGHSGDLIPADYQLARCRASDTYRDAAFVIRETERLAQQLAEQAS